MIKTLRPYQQDALNTIRLKLKQNLHPIVVNASVGAGKSLIIAELLKIMERHNFKALCLTMNSILIEQNAQTYIEQGGTCGIYCANLNQKNIDKCIIFASPHSVAQSLKKQIGDIKFNLIVIDECHNINHNDKKSMYMRILNHYGFKAQNNNYNFRVIGLTGTPYRGKNIHIVGENEYFKEQVVDINTSWLIENGYLVKPIFAKTGALQFQTDSLKVAKNGKFKHKHLAQTVENKPRLTQKIIEEIINIVESGRNGAFIFASTIAHANECMTYLQNYRAEIITGDTSSNERKKILQNAKAGNVKYLVNVGTLLVGVDVPNFDTCCWLRPTESLTLFIQGIGRVLRLHKGKSHCLILDYAGNLKRHGDIDNPIINEAIEQKDKDDPQYCIKCYHCETLNKVTARRCIGIKNSKRCDYFFEFKECPKCKIENDKTSRQCRNCNYELIDPNSKLSLVDDIIFEVKKMKCTVMHSYAGYPIVKIIYLTIDNKYAYEMYYLKNEKSKNYFYGKFVKKHINNASYFYKHLNNINMLKKMIMTDIVQPSKIVCKVKDNILCVVDKIF